MFARTALRRQRGAGTFTSQMELRHRDLRERGMNVAGNACRMSRFYTMQRGEFACGLCGSWLK